jgi:thiamine-monophosphate kinase
MKTLVEIGEWQLIQAIQAKVEDAHLPRVELGIGDDAAVLNLFGKTVLSTDTLIENVDWSFHWASYFDVGLKAAAVNLSDLAAMGAAPKALLLTLCLRADDKLENVLDLVDGFISVAKKYNVAICGGDISQISGPLVVSVTAVGESRNKIFKRYQGQVGDAILVSGVLGEAAGALYGFQNQLKVPSSIAERQLRPEPQLALSAWLEQQEGIQSVADISDGLVRDVLHVVSPDFGVEIFQEALPYSDELEYFASYCKMDVRNWAFAGGEDFELVLAVENSQCETLIQNALLQGFQLTQIGRICSRPGLHGVFESAHAYTHFQK